MTATVSEDCGLCRRLVYTSGADRQLVALHRMEHRQADRRRAQYRAAKARKRRTDGRVGALHALGCPMPKRCNCKPIPVYRLEQEAA